MAYSNYTLQQLGNTLQQAFTDGLFINLNLDYPEWEMILKQKTGPADGRSMSYLLETSLGPSAIQYRNPGVTYDFPTDQQSTQAEGTMVYKELMATVSFQQNLFDALEESKAKYVADRMAREVEAKNTALRRQMSMDLWQDGSGIIATSSATMTINADGNVVLTLASGDTDRGFAGLMQFNDLVKHYTTAAVAGAAPTLTTGTFSHWRVVSRNTRLSVNSVTLRARNTAGAESNTTAFVPVAGEVFYRVEVQSNNTVVANPVVLASVSDWGSASLSIVGMESLAASDGRIVNGIAMSGATSGTVYDVGGGALTNNDLSLAMNVAKNTVGQGRYHWKKAFVNRDIISSLIDTQDGSRRFNSYTDQTSGKPGFTYAHEDDQIRLVGTEFLGANRAWILPDGKIEGKEVVQFHGSDFKAVRGGIDGSVFHLAPGTTGGHRNLILSYLRGRGNLCCVHPAAVVKVHNFTI